MVAGVSGGADSICLLKVLKEFQNPMNLKIFAVHVHHGLRGKEADEDQNFVEELCEKWDIPLKTFKVDIKGLSREQGISLEEAGREARYRLFNQVLDETGANYIAVAHQQEDQAETIMLHILRGTGLDGLCGMSPKQGRIIRPLLNSSRAQILRFLDENKISYRVDSSNLDSDYTRNRIRNILFPTIQEMFMVNPANQLLRLSEIVQGDKDFLENTAEKAYNSVRLNDTNEVEISIDELKIFHPAIIKRIIRHAWEKINKNKKNLEQIHVDQILDLCMKNHTGKRIMLPQGIEARVAYGKLIISKQQFRLEETYSYKIEIEGVTKALKAGGTLHGNIMAAAVAFTQYGSPEIIKENNLIQLFDYDKLSGGIILRNRKPGDLIRPYGSSGEKKLKEYFIDKKIPREKRDRVPLVVQGDRVVWIIGMRTSQDFRADHDSKKILVLEWRN